MSVGDLIRQIAESRSGLLGYDFKFAAPILGDEIFDEHGASLHDAKNLSSGRLCTAHIPMQSPCGSNGNMDKHRYRKLWLLSFKKQLGSTKALAEKLETDANSLSAILGPKAKRNLGDELARRAEQMFGLPEGTLDLPGVTTHRLIAASDGLDDRDVDGVIAYIKLMKAQKKTGHSPPLPLPVKERGRDKAKV